MAAALPPLSLHSFAHLNLPPLFRSYLASRSLFRPHRSVANEPDSEASAAATYFKHLVAQTKALDPSRPVSFASFKSAEKDLAAAHVDVIMINKYHGWYV